ncbi:hypothetical protein DPMN_045815 [Dreissena polymorpha]|uniref:Uncharacterized protein n=1 Tax=Dreissena polymorpha TaxID=45954 RepID=A0A9D4D518_DREPO|nr:hypothetical protein DPMN_045815 [Dreissena polymorpha]
MTSGMQIGETCTRLIYILSEKVEKVVSIKHERMDMEGSNVLSESRVVTIQVDKETKNSIPHLVNFACRAKALLSVGEWQPLCLTCMRLGHIRGGCPGNVNAQEFFCYKENSSDAPPDNTQGGTRAQVVGRKSIGRGCIGRGYKGCPIRRYHWGGRCQKPSVPVNPQIETATGGKKMT